MIENYLAAEYRVAGNPGFVMKIGQRSHKAVDCVRTVGPCFFITAYNPLSVEPDGNENIENSIRLRQRIGGKVRLGQGVDPTGFWKPEMSYLAPFGSRTLADVMQIAVDFGQYAFVVVGDNGTPELHVTPLCPHTV